VCATITRYDQAETVSSKAIQDHVTNEQ
jgi:hypothetical protein